MKKKIDLAIECVFFVFACFILLFLVIGTFTMADESRGGISEYSVLQTDWYRVMDDGSRIPVEVPGKLDVPRGEPARITTVLPDNVCSDTTRWLCFNPSKQDMEVYIDGELRKSFSTEKTRPWGDISVTAYFFVPLSADDCGKEMTVVFSSNSAYSGVIHQVFCGTVFGCWQNFVKENIVAVIGALFIIVFSVISIITSAVMRLKTGKRFYLGYLACGVLMLSLWVICQAPVRQLYFSNISLAGCMTHFLMYLFVTPIVVYIDHIQERRYYRLYRVFLVISLSFVVAAAAAEISGIIDYSVLQLVNSAIQFLAIADICVTFVLDFKRGYIKNYRLIACGFIGVALCGMIQLFKYFQRTEVFDGSILCVGAVFLLIMAVISTIRDYIRMGDEIEKSRRKNQQLTYQIMETIVRTIEAKDEYTKGHSTRVAQYSMLLAEKMGMSEEEQMSIFFMGTLHDVGKIGISDEIINKPGKLTDEEYAVIKSHSVVGYNILLNMSELKDVEYGARWHHERYDGRGYPDGLSGEDIPIYARIIAVADAYDAMTSNRSYRSVMPQEKVREEILRSKGTQLDPVIADFMIELIDADPEYQMRQNVTD